MTMILLFSITSSSFLCFSKMKGSDNQEKLVYQVIEDAGNKGILKGPGLRPKTFLYQYEKTNPTGLSSRIWPAGHAFDICAIRA